MKAVNLVRVNPTAAQRLYSESKQLGNPQFCGAGHERLEHDQYGRLVNGYTVQNTTDASCGNLSQFNVTERLAIENSHRQYVAMPPAGQRGGDTMNVGRRNIPRDVYGTGRGGWARQYPGNNMPPPEQCPVPSGGGWVGHYPQPYDNSMDSTQRRLIL